MLNISRPSPLHTGSNLPTEIHPVLRRIYAARNVQSATELDYSLQRLLPYQSLSNIHDATVLLAQAIQTNKRILIVADFDVDGATSCALSIRGLRLMGATDIDYIVPNRFEFGYGLSEEITRLAIHKKPDLIVTVDNGISSIAGVKLAREQGVDVLITDHHLPGTELPDANVIVNPNQKDDQFPSKMLAGVGVIFYILIALRAYLEQQGWFEKLPRPNLGRLLDLVALGTVADVVPMDRNNRVLISQGIARIRSGRCCLGIKSLLQLARRTIANVTAQDLGFAVAPRLNAAGRLEDMSLGIECLLTDDEQQAKKIAHRLDELNIERRQIQGQMQQQATHDLAKLSLNEKDHMPYGICLFNADWHQGVIGIIASRIKDKLHRPVIIFAKDKDGFIKGSARSISCVHIRDVLDAIATQQPDLIDKFGGHAMAAGLRLKETDYPRFKQAFEQRIKDSLTKSDLHDSLYSDGQLKANEINIELAQKIMHAGPWGQGFTEPYFDGEFELISSRIVGEKHLRLCLRAANHSDIIDAIFFNFTEQHWDQAPARIYILYRLEINEYQGRCKLQLVIKELAAINH